jgi:DHA2 family multidrug resistance protein-like MFS transporter
MTVGFAVLATAGAVALPAVVAGTVIFSVGLAPAYILTTDLVVSTVRPERAGMAAAVTETGTELGGALGIAVLGSVGVAAYRHELPGTLVDALTRAASLPPAAASDLRQVAEHAYTNAFVLMSVIAAVVVAIAAALAAAFLRPAPALASVPAPVSVPVPTPAPERAALPVPAAARAGVAASELEPAETFTRGAARG